MDIAIDLGPDASAVCERDWVSLIVNDPNGPTLAILGTVSGSDNDRIAIQVDDSGAAFWIPFSTIRHAYHIDGPVTDHVEFDPQRP